MRDHARRVPASSRSCSSRPAATCARRHSAPGSRAATMGGATDNTGDHRRDGGAARRAGAAARLCELCAYRLDDAMAKTPAAVHRPARRASGRRRAAASWRSATPCRHWSAAEGGNFRLAPWDWRYYAEKLRKARFDLDESEIKPYLPLDSMIEAAFYTATRLFGLTFTPRADVPVYHPDVRVWEVQRRRTASIVGLFFGDYFARASKRSGAWMTTLARPGEARRRDPPARPQRHEFLQGRRRASRRCCPSTMRARCSTNSATACTACCPT